jgi:small-conductance mechanosensitive channel
MAEATSTLPEINDRLAEVAAGAAKIPDIERRMETIESAMPTLVEVQQHLRDLPHTMAELQAALVPLIEAAETLGRVTRRLPRRRGPEAP